MKKKRLLNSWYTLFCVVNYDSFPFSFNSSSFHVSSFLIRLLRFDLLGGVRVGCGLAVWRPNTDLTPFPLDALTIAHPKTVAAPQTSNSINLTTSSSATITSATSTTVAKSISSLSSNATSSATSTDNDDGDGNPSGLLDDSNKNKVTTTMVTNTAASSSEVNVFVFTHSCVRCALPPRGSLIDSHFFLLSLQITPCFMRCKHILLFTLKYILPQVYRFQ